MSLARMRSRRALISFTSLLTLTAYCPIVSDVPAADPPPPKAKVEVPASPAEKKPPVAVVPSSQTKKPDAAAAPSSGEPLWIWSPTQSEGPVPEGAVYFRKRFNSSTPETAWLQITCDDSYEAYVNGRLVGTGKDWHRMQTFNLLPFVVEGSNLIAIKAQNTDGISAGLTARVLVQKKGSTAVAYVTDQTWLTSAVEYKLWEKERYDDAKWLPAHSFGELGTTKPWLDAITADDGSSARRFAVTKDFRIERVVAPLETGSLLAMTFNEFGEILAGRETGPILLIVDSNKDGAVDRVTEFCTEVTSAQGLLALNGNVYAVGTGPEGVAVYLISDENHDGKSDKVQTLLKFEGQLGEHGPHGLTLGPDGMIYMMVGNHAQAVGATNKESPYRDFYEGDLLVPRYEDPGGHAVGIKAPGGTVVRFDLDGKNSQLFAGGFRNAYDLAFNREGELFSFDSDMEWNEGLPFYRATRLQHIFAGSEHGWRSGWANWTDYYHDGVPPAATAGRGSPTGIEFYEHEKFPPQYRGALFACDWSQGEIIAFKPRPSGSGYVSEGEVFVRGRPLAATDIAVGPDGWLYFVTGGRGTEGGVYRVIYTGQITPPQKVTGLASAVRQPQMGAAWARQAAALVQQDNEKTWGPQLMAVASNATNRSEDRVRALDLLELYGPMPDVQFFIRLSRDQNPAVRRKVAFLLGVHAQPLGGGLLVQMLRDVDPAVRRQACESLVRGRFVTPPEALIPLLSDTDRAVSFTARLALERVPVERWKQTILDTRNIRTFSTGAVALIRVSPDRETGLAILNRGSAALKGEISDPDFFDLLRAFELALELGKIKVDELVDLRKQLADEYPANDLRMNRELIRLLAYLDESSVLPRVIEYLKGDAPTMEKLQTGLFARYFTTGWTTPEKLYLLAFYEAARKLQGGYSLKGYFTNVCKDFCATLTPKERLALLAHGDKQPNNALAILQALTEIEPGLVETLIELDRKLRDLEGDDIKTLKTGIVAILGESGDEAGMAYLREAFEKQPERRAELAMGLAQQPGGENYPLLLRSLPVVEGLSAQEVLLQLAKTDKKPEGPEPIRQAILVGLRLNGNGSDAAIKLLTKWTGTPPALNAKWSDSLAMYQKWFSEKYPDAPPATPPKAPVAARYSLDELTAYLTESGSKGDAARGEHVFAKANCLKCHRFGNQGEAIGPDLSNVSLRFQRREILESILHPSQVISDQYASKTVTTVDGKVVVGLVAPAGTDAIVVLQPTAEKVNLPKADVESITANKQSAMPEGLLNTLQLQDVADLFAYLNAGAKARTDFATDQPTDPVNTSAQSRRTTEQRK